MIPDEQVEQLEYLLDQTGQPHMETDALQGFLAAVAIGPQVISPTRWLPEVFETVGGTPPEFGKNRETEPLLEALINYYTDTLQCIQDKTLEPVLPVDEREENPIPIVDDWCKGFVLGVKFWGEGWGSRPNSEALQAGVLAIYYLADPESFTKLYDAGLAEEIAKSELAFARSLPFLVSEIFTYWQGQGAPAPDKNIGRNDPCPCGSGKKYKKCCGAIG